VPLQVEGAASSSSSLKSPARNEICFYLTDYLTPVKEPPKELAASRSCVLRDAPPVQPWGTKTSGSNKTCMGLFLSSGCFGFAVSSLFGAGRPFFVPSPAIRFPERAEGVKGPKR
jgi:hypothetical protein